VASSFLVFRWLYKGQLCHSLAFPFLRRYLETPLVELAFIERLFSVLKISRSILLRGRRQHSFVYAPNGKRGSISAFSSAYFTTTKHRQNLIYGIVCKFLVCTTKANQGINRTFIQLARGVSAQWLRPTMSFVGCIKACYRIR